MANARVIGGGGPAVVLAMLLAGCAAPARPASVAVVRPVGPNSVDRLVGETPTVLRGKFGPPALIRHDGPAEVWLYSSSTCAIDLILYADRASEPARVVTVEARPSRARLSDEGCVASMEGTDHKAGQLARGSF